MAAISRRHRVSSGLLSLGVLLALTVMALPLLDAPERRPTPPQQKAQKTQPPPSVPEPVKTLVLPEPPPLPAPPEASASWVTAKPGPEPVADVEPTQAQKSAQPVKVPRDAVLKPTKWATLPESAVNVLRPTVEPPAPKSQPLTLGVLRPTPPRPEIPKLAGSDAVPATITTSVVKSIPRPVPKPMPVPVEHAMPRSAPPVAATPSRSTPPMKVKAAAQPTLRPARSATPSPPPEVRSPVANRTGRVLLRQLEHGRGPGIEIVWPADPRQRQRLYALLFKCHGMRAARMNEDGRLYVAEGTPGQPWLVDMDRMSGFVRQVSGAMTPAERGAVERIGAYHGSRIGGAVVRLFPRAVDAGLLGGIHALGGLDYGASRSVTAGYAIEAGRVVIRDIRIDGRLVEGGFALPRAGGGCRS